VGDLPLPSRAGRRTLVLTETGDEGVRAEMPTPAGIRASVVSRDGTEIAYWTSGSFTGHRPTARDGNGSSPPGAAFHRAG